MVYVCLQWFIEFSLVYKVLQWLTVVYIGLHCGLLYLTIVYIFCRDFFTVFYSCLQCLQCLQWFTMVKSGLQWFDVVYTVFTVIYSGLHLFTLVCLH